MEGRTGNVQISGHTMVCSYVARLLFWPCRGRERRSRAVSFPARIFTTCLHRLQTTRRKPENYHTLRGGFSQYDRKMDGYKQSPFMLQLWVMGSESPQTPQLPCGAAPTSANHLDPGPTRFTSLSACQVCWLSVVSLHHHLDPARFTHSFHSTNLVLAVARLGSCAYTLHFLTCLSLQSHSAGTCTAF